MVNIAEILKNFPQGTKLWSNVVGDCTLDNIKSDGEICVLYGPINTTTYFYENGGYLVYSDLCNLFPSKEMQDWSKLTWKKGDVLSCGANRVVFDKWKDGFDTFYGKFYNLDFVNKSDYPTKVWEKATEEQHKEYIEKIEGYYGGKLNLDTLHIKEQESKKCEFEPFQKVMVKDKGEIEWKADFFSNMCNDIDYPFVCVGGWYEQCIPYNKETEHLLGTDKEAPEKYKTW